MTATLIALGLKLWPYIAGAVALLFGAWKIDRNATARERNKQAAKERDAYAKHIQDIERAADARNRIGTGGVSDDPYRRD